MALTKWHFDSAVGAHYHKEMKYRGYGYLRENTQAFIEKEVSGKYLSRPEIITVAKRAVAIYENDISIENVVLRKAVSLQRGGNIEIISLVLRSIGTKLVVTQEREKKKSEKKF